MPYTELLFLKPIQEYQPAPQDKYHYQTYISRANLSDHPQPELKEWLGIIPEMEGFFLDKKGRQQDRPLKIQSKEGIPPSTEIQHNSKICQDLIINYWRSTTLQLKDHLCHISPYRYNFGDQKHIIRQTFWNENGTVGRCRLEGSMESRKCKDSSKVCPT